MVYEYRSDFMKNVIDVPPFMVRTMWKSGKIVIVDIREPWEYQSHHIPGALLIPMNYLELASSFLRTREVAVVCEHANRSTRVTRERPHLFKLAYNMLGGMEGWMRNGFEVVSGYDEGAEFYKTFLHRRNFSNSFSISE
jgi:rhodanese-related sulfurtransferase